MTSVWINGKREEEKRIRKMQQGRRYVYSGNKDWPIKVNKQKYKSKTNVNFLLIYQENYNGLLFSGRYGYKFFT